MNEFSPSKTTAWPASFIRITAPNGFDGQVILEHAGGARTVLSVTRGGVFRTLLRSVQEDMEFGVTGGDDQDGAPLVAVTVLRPPDIVGLAVEVTPPAYTGAAASIVTDADVITIVIAIVIALAIITTTIATIGAFGTT